MYYSWLDRWDQKQIKQGEARKRVFPFELGAELCCDDPQNVTTLEAFCARGETFLDDPNFYEPSTRDVGFERNGDMLTFASEITTDLPQNNKAWCHITESKESQHALVLFHHWGAQKRNIKLAKLFSSLGITVVEFALPYHFERGRDIFDTNLFFSPNLGRSVQSTRQSVLDARRLIGWATRKFRYSV